MSLTASPIFLSSRITLRFRRPFSASLFATNRLPRRREDMQSDWLQSESRSTRHTGGKRVRYWLHTAAVGCAPPKEMGTVLDWGPRKAPS